ncbi:FxSxx-COOH cyclophane-containing RiPP peptide [Micromonospora sp. WMMD998]|uniref:FxSxx-COOH cyclophane-containing RiPP peptide n=1 Tax=Micromonospora sp. WMMD998 TaxID=3016092 RepID=UPI00249A12E8|nr:FxSxx-COOH cyclophane-containing RiPP peptide [Micromonospora sp. WMMD998]WFE38213.1 FxSxx-COOH protein [Micromonospora sp. WMMD998]
MDAEEDMLRSDLIDLTDVDLTALDAVPSAVLVAALHRLERRSADLGDQYAAFESALDGQD